MAPLSCKRASDCFCKFIFSRFPVNAPDAVFYSATVCFGCPIFCFVLVLSASLCDSAVCRFFRLISSVEHFRNFRCISACTIERCSSVFECFLCRISGRTPTNASLASSRRTPGPTGNGRFLAVLFRSILPVLKRSRPYGHQSGRQRTAGVPAIIAQENRSAGRNHLLNIRPAEHPALAKVSLVLTKGLRVPQSISQCSGLRTGGQSCSHLPKLNTAFLAKGLAQSLFK